MKRKIIESLSIEEAFKALNSAKILKEYKMPQAIRNATRAVKDTDWVLAFMTPSDVISSFLSNSDTLTKDINKAKFYSNKVWAEDDINIMCDALNLDSARCRAIQVSDAKNSMADEDARKAASSRPRPTHNDDDVVETTGQKLKLNPRWFYQTVDSLSSGRRVDWYKSNPNLSSILKTLEPYHKFRLNNTTGPKSFTSTIYPKLKIVSTYVLWKYLKPVHDWDKSGNPIRREFPHAVGIKIGTGEYFVVSNTFDRDSINIVKCSNYDDMCNQILKIENSVH